MAHITAAWMTGESKEYRMARKQLKIVRLLEPEICIDCRFSNMAEVESVDGSVQRMIYCKRLDCDNWDFTDAENATNVNVDGDGEEDQAA
jgi:hypothetical protein